MKHAFQKSLLGAAIIAAAMPMVVLAEEPAATGNLLEEIIVTAQKREQRLQDIPFSISVVTGDALEKAKMISLEDVVATTPSVSFGKSASSRGDGIQVRGIGTVSFADGIEGAVGTVIDGVVIGRQSAGLNDLFDVERIEILRGPQGTLFGKNTSAGLINIITKRPTEHTEGSAKISYGSDNELLLNGVISGSLNEEITGRLSVYRNTRDGVLNQVNPNISQSKVDDKDEWGLRAKLLASPSDKLSIYTIAEYAKEDQECCGRTEISYPTTSPIFNFLGLGQGLTPGVGNRDSDASSIAAQSSTTKALSTEVEYDFDNDFTFKSITAFRQFETFEHNDPDNGPTELVEFAGTDTKIRQYTQEFQLVSPSDEKLEYVVGAFFFKQELDSLTSFSGVLTQPTASSTTIFNHPLYGPIPVPVPTNAGIFGFTPSVITTTQAQVTENENAALYSQGTYSFNDQWALTAGGRVIREKLSIDFTRTPELATGVAIGAGTVITNMGLPASLSNSLVVDDSVTDTAYTGMLSLQYFHSNDTTAYATLSRGYKGAGLEIGISNGGLLKPESPTNFEVGINTSLFDNRMYLSVSAYYTNYKNFQSTVAADSGLFTMNVPNVRSQGLEVEFIAHPTENLTLAGGFAWVDAFIEDIDLNGACYSGQTAAQGCVAGNQKLEGTSMPNSPEYTANLTANYAFSVADDIDGYANVSYSWRDEVNFGLNNDPGTHQKAFGLLNARFGLLFTSGIEISLWGKNLTGEDYALRKNENFIFAGGGGYQQYIGQDRQVGADIKYSF